MSVCFSGSLPAYSYIQLLLFLFAAQQLMRNTNNSLFYWLSEFLSEMSTACFDAGMWPVTPLFDSIVYRAHSSCSRFFIDSGNLYPMHPFLCNNELMENKIKDFRKTTVANDWLVSCLLNVLLRYTSFRG